VVVCSCSIVFWIVAPQCCMPDHRTNTHCTDILRYFRVLYSMLRLTCCDITMHLIMLLCRCCSNQGPLTLRERKLLFIPLASTLVHGIAASLIATCSFIHIISRALRAGLHIRIYILYMESWKLEVGSWEVKSGGQHGQGHTPEYHVHRS